MNVHRSVSQRMTPRADSALLVPNRRLFLRWCAAAAVIGPMSAGVIGCGRRDSTRKPVQSGESKTPQPDERPGVPTREPTVRVRIAKLRNRSDALKIGETDQWLALSRPDALDRPIALRAPVIVALASNGWSVVDEKGFRPIVTGMADVVFRRLKYAPSASRAIPTGPDRQSSAPVMFNQAQYPGRLRLVSRTDLAPNAIDVVNDVLLEQYLPGVVAAELFSHWSIQTFAALAVAARSFACCEHAFFNDRRHYDLTNTAASQMYAGAVDHERARRAVNTTRGVVLVWNDRLVPGYYASCCGGQPAAAVDAIGPNPINDIAPLAGAANVDACRQAPVYEWTIKRTVHEITRRLTTWAEVNHIKPLSRFTRVKAIVVADRHHTGRARLHTIVDRTGAEMKLPARHLRRACNYTGRGLRAPKEPLLSSNVEVTIKRSTVTFKGRGFGHGAGLCQYGAQALAKSGERFQSILRTYYPEVELMRAFA